MKKECKIIQDLLPNYIANNTKQETNKEIEDHILNCKRCKKDLQKIKQAINDGRTIEEYKEEINNMKRKMKQIKIVIFSVIIIILLIIVADVSYKYMIFSKMVDKNINYDAGNNYKKTVVYDDNVTHLYYKDGISKLIGDNYIIWQNDVNNYVIIPDNKIYYDGHMGSVPLNKVTLFVWLGGIIDEIKPIEKLQFVLTNNMKIYDEIYNNKEYLIVQTKEAKLWINKETYFVERQIWKGQTADTKLEMDIVTDEDVKLPDLTKYEKIEENQ